jgi:hypothetical protein
MSVIKDALRLVLRHWPVLFALAFGALAAHQGMLRLARWVAVWHPAPALLLFALAGGCLLTGLGLMVRTVRPSLPDPVVAQAAVAVGPSPFDVTHRAAPAAVSAVKDRRAALARRFRMERRWPALLGAVVPFLVMYVAFGRVHDDLSYVLGDTAAPLPGSTVLWLAGLAAGALVVRLLLGFWRVRQTGGPGLLRPRSGFAGLLGKKVAAPPVAFAGHDIPGSIDYPGNYNESGYQDSSGRDGLGRDRDFSGERDYLDNPRPLTELDYPNISPADRDFTHTSSSSSPNDPYGYPGTHDRDSRGAFARNDTSGRDLFAHDDSSRDPFSRGDSSARDSFARGESSGRDVFGADFVPDDSFTRGDTSARDAFTRGDTLGGGRRLDPYLEPIEDRPYFDEQDTGPAQWTKPSGTFPAAAPSGTFDQVRPPGDDLARDPFSGSDRPGSRDLFGPAGDLAPPDRWAGGPDTGTGPARPGKGRKSASPAAGGMTGAFPAGGVPAQDPDGRHYSDGRQDRDGSGAGDWDDGGGFGTSASARLGAGSPGNAGASAGAPGRSWAGGDGPDGNETGLAANGAIPTGTPGSGTLGSGRPAGKGAPVDKKAAAAEKKAAAAALKAEKAARAAQERAAKAEAKAAGKKPVKAEPEDEAWLAQLSDKSDKDAWRATAKRPGGAQEGGPRRLAKPDLKVDWADEPEDWFTPEPGAPGNGGPGKGGPRKPLRQQQQQQQQMRQQGQQQHGQQLSGMDDERVSGTGVHYWPGADLLAEAAQGEPAVKAEPAEVASPRLRAKVKAKRVSAWMIKGYFGVTAAVLAAAAVVVFWASPAGVRMAESVPSWLAAPAVTIGAVLLVPLAWFMFTVLAYRRTTLPAALLLSARAGLAPVAVFCLAFAVVRGLSQWSWELVRVSVGPQDIELIWEPVIQLSRAVTDGVAAVLFVCLSAVLAVRALNSEDERLSPSAQVEAGEGVLPGEAEPHRGGVGSGWRDEEDEGLVAV